MSALFLGRAVSHRDKIFRASQDPAFISRFAAKAGISPEKARAILFGRMYPSGEEQRIIESLAGIHRPQERDPDPDHTPPPDPESYPDELPDYD